eukprot:m.652485 g.652485  ORF g.652485 m.652485 type:complete len:71 (+) comp22691_c0_seq2:792-1004(+)
MLSTPPNPNDIRTPFAPPVPQLAGKYDVHLHVALNAGTSANGIPIARIPIDASAVTIMFPELRYVWFHET